MQVTPNVRAVQVPDDNPMHPVFTTIYLVGRGQVMTIDSGEDMDRYRWMLRGYLAATERAEIAIAAISHHHFDHSANLKFLRDQFKAEVYVHPLGEPMLKDRLPETGVHELAEGQEIDVNGVRVHVLHTPGHSADSVCYYIEDEGVLFSGDTLLGTTTTTVGDLADYMRSLERLLALPNLKVICPGHGPVIENPREYIEGYIRHRNERERQIVDALAAGGAMTSWEIMETIYTDIDTRLRRAADGNVRTHLRKLEKEGRVKVHPGKPRQRPAAEVEREREEEHARQEVIKKAEEYQRQARLRALFLQENPPLEQWEEMPRYERTA
jgi:glyoxylase-like metal-dependent hydrolase (beta-lactamase superfamily II)